MNASSAFISSPKLDTYALYARALPVLLVALPGALASVAWFPEAKTWWSAISGLLAGCGIPVLLSQIGRDSGKNKESALFESWGGKPTTRFLRHRDAPNKVLLAQHHRKLQDLFSDIRIPSAQDEAANPNGADEVYDACVALLREKTRDKQRFPILYGELVSYGFRRNLWGMKPLGIAVALAGTVAISVLLILRLHQAEPPSPIAVMVAASDLLFLAAWLFWIKPDWVRIPAEAYAGQLLIATENLSGGNKDGKQS